MISFRVFGEAQPKGSTRAFVRQIKGKARAIITSDNPSLAKWEQLVRFEAQTALRMAKHTTCPFFDGPVLVEISIGLVRPPSVSARKRPMPIVKPDIDKILRACIDPLSGVFFRDDCQAITRRQVGISRWKDGTLSITDGRPERVKVSA